MVVDMLEEEGKVIVCLYIYFLKFVWNLFILGIGIMIDF